MQCAPSSAQQRARRFRWASLVLLWLLFLVLGCSRSTTSERQEFARISRAIDEVRNAANPDKQALLPRLAGAACATECVLRDICERAYSHHVRALLLLDQAKRSTEDVVGATQKLNESSQLLTQAQGQIEACTTMQADRRRALAL